MTNTTGDLLEKCSNNSLRNSSATAREEYEWGSSEWHVPEPGTHGPKLGTGRLLEDFYVTDLADIHLSTKPSHLKVGGRRANEGLSISVSIVENGFPTLLYKLTTSNLQEVLDVLKTYPGSLLDYSVKQKGCNCYVKVVIKQRQTRKRKRGGK